MELRSGQVAVITGGASGIGHAMARNFAGRGLKLVLADIETTALDAAVNDLSAAGAEVIGVATDVSKADRIENLADAAYRRFGAVNVLCNNAGVVKRGRMWEQTLEDWEWVIGVDLWSVVHGARTFIPRMIEGGQPGYIVNTASTAGLAAFPGIASYDVAKSGVVALSEALWHELRQAGAPIGVSVLCPGLVATRIGDSERNRPGVAASAKAAPISMRDPGAVAMTPEDCAKYVADAIEAEQFWMITHPAYDEFISARMKGMLNRRDVIEPRPI
jgi:short-subunit dehydrogenase